MKLFKKLREHRRESNLSQKVMIKSRNDRIDIPLDKPSKKSRTKDATEIAVEQQDQDIINIIRNTNSGIVPDGELTASEVARGG